MPKNEYSLAELRGQRRRIRHVYWLLLVAILAVIIARILHVLSVETTLLALLLEAGLLVVAALAESDVKRSIVRHLVARARNRSQ